jgi:anti-anti-sigma regulatory factor
MTFSSGVEMKGREAWITLAGELDAALAGEFRQATEQVAGQKSEKACPAWRGPLKESCAD